MTENPKLVGSGIVDCIPQTGECPNRCSECFYNGGRFFRTLDEPLLPSVEEIGDRIVRVNSGNDSNNKRELVLEKTAQYRHKFFNTSVPKLDFPAPVVLTLNPQHADDLALPAYIPANLMFVRVRAGLWDVEPVRRALDHFRGTGVPVVVTFMRFYDREKIPQEPREWLGCYEWRKHITNAYWIPIPEEIVRYMRQFDGSGLRMCGTPWSSRCVDCGHCEEFYWATLRRMEKADARWP